MKFKIAVSVAFVALFYSSAHAQDIVSFISTEVCSCLTEMHQGNPSFDSEKDLEHCFESVILENQEAIEAVYGADIFENEDEAARDFGMEIGKKLAKDCELFIDIYVQQAKDKEVAVQEHAANGRQLAKEEKHEQAIAEFSKAIALNPNSTEYLNLRGVSYFALEEYYRAIADFYRAIEADENNHLPYHNMAFSKYRLGDSESALGDVEKAIALNPTYVLSRNLKGLILNNMNKMEEARESFLEAYRLDEKDSDYPFNVAHTFYQERNFEMALEWFLKAEGLGESSLTLLSKVGNCYDILGNYPKAIDYQSRAITLDPDDYGVYYNRGIAYFNQESFDLAIKDLERALALVDDDEDVLYYLSRTYEKLGKIDEALASVEKAMALDSRNASYYDLRAGIFESQGKLDLAIEDYTVSVSLYPDDCEIHMALGKLFAKTQQPERAQVYFQQALERGCEDAGGYLTMR